MHCMLDLKAHLPIWKCDLVNIVVDWTKLDNIWIKMYFLKVKIYKGVKFVFAPKSM